MSNFKIFSDSSCDLDSQFLNEYDLQIIPFYISFDYKNYLKEGVDISKQVFYDKFLSCKNLPKTSLPTINDYITKFEPTLKNGFDILCICLSSKLSGSYQSAVNAKNILSETYPNQNIFIVDSKQATGTQGLLVLEALKMHKAGFDIKKTYEVIEKLKETASLIFSVDSLDHLAKGGRIGKVASIAGNILNIKPIIVLKDGEIEPLSKTHGRKKSILQIVNNLFDIIKHDLSSYEIIFMNSNCNDEVCQMINLAADKYSIKSNYPTLTAGTSIACHTGPTALGIGYIKKYEYFI